MKPCGKSLALESDLVHISAAPLKGFMALGVLLNLSPWVPCLYDGDDRFHGIVRMID